MAFLVFVLGGEAPCHIEAEQFLNKTGWEDISSLTPSGVDSTTKKPEHLGNIVWEDSASERFTMVKLDNFTFIKVMAK